MVLMGHGTFHSNTVYFALITGLIEYRKKLAKITAKSKKKNKTIVKDRCFRFQNWVYQNVSNEALSAWFKLQAKIPTCSEVLRKSDWNTPVSPTPLFKDKGLKDIRHNMSTGNLILVVNSVTVSYLICYNSLLQNATDVITKCDSYFFSKCDRSLLQNASTFYYKMRQFYYKMRQSSQIATTSLQNATVITKCDVYYKLWQYSHFQ